MLIVWLQIGICDNPPSTLIKTFEDASRQNILSRWYHCRGHRDLFSHIGSFKMFSPKIAAIDRDQSHYIGTGISYNKGFVYFKWLMTADKQLILNRESIFHFHGKPTGQSSANCHYVAKSTMMDVSCCWVSPFQNKQTDHWWLYNLTREILALFVRWGLIYKLI